MNTKSLLTRIGVPVLSLGLLGGLGATLATSASASTAVTTASVSKTVVATTYSPNHYDTTSVQTGVNTPGGPLWAYDNLTEKFTAVPRARRGPVVRDHQRQGHLRRVREPDQRSARGQQGHRPRHHPVQRDLAQHAQQGFDSRRSSPPTPG